MGYPSTVLPAPLLHADRALHALHQRRSFSQHLNPLNGPEASRSFRSGAEAPPFRYRPTTWADEELRRVVEKYEAEDSESSAPSAVAVVAVLDATRRRSAPLPAVALLFLEHSKYTPN